MKVARLALLIAAVALLVGCTDTPAPIDPPSVTVASTPTVTTPSTASLSPTPSLSAAPTAGAAAITAYLAFREEYAASLRRGTLRDSKVANWSTGTALIDAQAALLNTADRGIVYRGAPRFSPSVMSTADARVDLSDCVDISGWTPVFKDTGASALAPGQRDRLQVYASVVRVAGEWKVDTMTTDREATC